MIDNAGCSGEQQFAGTVNSEDNRMSLLRWKLSEGKMLENRSLQV